MDSDWKAGLQDVIAARSAVCTIDGGAGRLYYRGYEIGELAGTVPFEDIEWKAYALVSWRLHAIDHLKQAKKVLAGGGR